MLENSLIDLKIVGFIIIFVILAFFLVKELKKNKTIPKEKSEKKIVTDDKKEVEELKTEIKIPKEIEKLFDNLDVLPDRDNQEKIDFNAQLIADKLHANFKTENEVAGTIYIDNDLFQKIGESIVSKLGPTLAPLARRVDSDGCIVLDMEAIKFITGEHIPLVTPSGAIRVMNFLTIEQDLELAISTEKPFFYKSLKTNKIEKLSKEQLNKLILMDDFVGQSEITAERELRLKTISEENEKQFLRIEQQEEKIKSLETENTKYKNQIEILLSMKNGNSQILETNKTEIIHKEIKDNEKIGIEEVPSFLTDDLHVENIPIVSETKETNISEINEAVIENIKPEATIEVKPEESKETETSNLLAEKKIDTKIIDEENQKVSTDKKINFITKKNSKEVFQRVFNHNKMFSKKILTNANTKAEKLIYISNVFTEFAKEYTLYFIETNFLKELKDIIEEEGFVLEQESIELIFTGRKYKSFVAYFTDKVEKKMYSTNIIQIDFSEDELLGLMLQNTRYSEVFTKEEAIKKLEIEQRDNFKKMYSRRLNDITNGNVNVF